MTPWLSSQPDPETRRAEIESRIPLGKRLTTTEEIAAMVIFLLSAQSSHTTGQITYVMVATPHFDRAYSGS